MSKDLEVAEPDHTGEITAQVLDPEEYTQHRRLRELYDQRREVQEVRRDLEMKVAQSTALPGESGFEREQAERVYATALESYLMELEPLAVHRYPDIGEEYWTEKPLGVARYEPPDISDEVDGTIEELETEPDAKTVEFVGLGSIIDQPLEFTFTFTAPVDIHGSVNNDPITVQETYPVRKNVLDAAYRQANLFLAEIGMDIDPEENTTGEWEV
jgi:hypothetical protein